MVENIKSVKAFFGKMPRFFANLADKRGEVKLPTARVGNLIFIITALSMNLWRLFGCNIGISIYKCCGLTVIIK